MTFKTQHDAFSSGSRYMADTIKQKIIFVIFHVCFHEMFWCAGTFKIHAKTREYFGIMLKFHRRGYI